MKRILNRVIALVAIALIYSCTEDINLDEFDITSGDKVTCDVSLTIDNMEQGTEYVAEQQSRAITADNVDENTIKNLWVIQLNSADEIIGVEYIKNAFDFSSVDLVPTTMKSTVYYIANSFNPNIPVFTGMTLSQFEGLGRSISQSADVLSVGDDGYKYLLMSGCSIYANGTNGSSAQTVTMHRSMAKISVQFTIAPDLNLDIAKVELFSVPQKLNYICSDLLGFDDNDDYPATSDFKTINYTHLNYENGAPEVFYMPENRRGEVSGTIAPKDKALYAKPNATSMKVYTTYEDAEGKTGSRIYTFYLGANFENDFNIKHNTKYDYQITFNSAGDAQTDSRIEEYTPTVDFSAEEKTANCYILNPNLYGDRTFYIPVTERINTFWGNVGYNDVAENCINENDLSENLVCDIIWGSNKELIKITPEIVSSPSNKTAIEVTLPSTIAHGNMMVGVRRADATNAEYLWSWHLWVTDYNPYTERMVRNGVYRYAVDGGEIHRYKDRYSSTKVWDNGGSMEGKFIMDRNIGQLSGNASYIDENLFYQYGRKDPFPGQETAYLANGGAYKAYDYNSSRAEDYAETVQNPRLFRTISGADYDWCGDANYINDQYKWNDPLCDRNTTEKSFFDPSPLGWKLAEHGTFTSFFNSTELSTKLIYYQAGSFGYYIDNKLVETYPKTGLLSSGNAGYSQDNRGLYWYPIRKANSIKESHAYKFNAPSQIPGTTTLNQGDLSWQAWGFAARCVQE